ncbi:MAG: phosphate ABC transporter permease subunit PstC [Leptolyngbyaceae cyanobacterium SL_7_1]|nr:phosphate ABC transporter permease subunit PstC [Leptolyngbyaceae cyanobacterium SL_7_1]
MLDRTQPMIFNDRPSPFKRWLNRGFILSTGLAALIVAGLVGWIGWQVAREAQPAIAALGWRFLLDRSWNPVTNEYGVLPMLWGTVSSAAIALLLATPIGIGTAIFLSEDFLPLPLRTLLVFWVELLAAIPSIVYGIWGFFILIPLLQPLGAWLHGTLGWLPVFSTPYVGPGLLPAGLLLTLMILPLITAIARDSLLALPSEWRDASLSLGASRWTTIFRVLIPAAASGIGAGVMLALGRALGETMAVTMVIGNSNTLSASLLAPSNTIASLLANQFNEARDLQVAALMYAALVLFGITLLVNVLAEWIVFNVQSSSGR